MTDNEGIRRTLLQRKYAKRKHDATHKSGSKTRHTSVRTWETRAEGMYQSASPLSAQGYDYLDVWMELALQNGERVRHQTAKHPLPVFPTPELTLARGLSFREGRLELENFLRNETRGLGDDASIASDLVFHVQNVVTWITTRPGLASILTRIFCVSKERTQFQSFKLWLRTPATMLSSFETGNALVNGCDNLADVLLAMQSVLFTLFMFTGILPYYTRVRSENITASADTHHPLDLARLFGVLKASCPDYLVRYNPKKFPGLSLVEKRATVLSAKGDPRKISIKCFAKGRFTLVGCRCLTEVYAMSNRIRTMMAFILQANT